MKLTMQRAGLYHAYNAEDRTAYVAMKDRTELGRWDVVLITMDCNQYAGTFPTLAACRARIAYLTGE